MRKRIVRPSSAARAGDVALVTARRMTAGGLALTLPVLAGAVLAPTAHAAVAPRVYTVGTIPVGNPQVFVAVDPTRSTVYATTNDGANLVSVIDEKTNTVTGTISVGDGADGIAVDPLISTVYVTNGLDNTVSVIDETTNTVTSTIDVGDHPFGVAVDPKTSTVYVVNDYSSDVSVIDETTNTVINTIGVGPYPYAPAVDPLTGTVFVPNTQGNSVSVIDEKTSAVSTIGVGNFPFGVAVDPLRGTAYVTNANDNTVSVIDEKTATVTSTIGTGAFPYGVAVDPTTSTVYVTNHSDNTVSVIDETTDTVTSTLGVGSSPVGVAVDTTSGAAYVADNADDSMSVITSVPAVAPSISGTPPSPATAGTPYSFAYSVSGTPTPTTTVTGGALPDGLTLSSDGTLSGTPTTAGSYTFTVTASNGIGSDASTQSTIVVDAAPVFTTASPALTATAGTPYTATFAATGSPTPTYQLSSGAPAFLSIDATTGKVSGTPTGPGRFSYAVSATNRAGIVTTKTFTVGVAGAWTSSVQGFTAPAAGSAKGFTLGVTNGNTWTLDVTQPAKSKTVYTGTITLDKGAFARVGGVKLEPGDTFGVNGNTLSFSFTDAGDIDGLTFTTPFAASTLTLDLKVAGAPATSSQIVTGQNHTPSPTGSPLTYRRATR